MTAAYPGLAYPGATYPGDTAVGGGSSTDRLPMDHLRLEVAFSTSPDDAAPAWVDLTSRLNLRQGVKIQRGRADEYDTTQTGTMNLTLNNTDGALTPEDSSSPYYPNVLPQRRIKLTYRDPATLGAGNLVTAENASFEGGTVGTWVPQNGATLSNSGTRAWVGTKSLQISWPTAGAGTLPWGQFAITGLAAGRAYIASAYVWTADSPNVAIGVYGLVNGTATTTKSAWTRITVAFTATSSTHLILVFTGGATTAGQAVWVDGVMVDEGTTPGAFTTALPAIVPKYDGHVDEWPLEWPGGSGLFSHSQLTCTDLLARIGKRQKLRSVVVETMALDGPKFHYPLDEPADSTMVSDVTPNAARALTVRGLGSGGLLEFAAGTGVPTDGASAPMFTPASATVGYYLDGVTGMYPGYAQTPFVMTAAFNTTETREQTVARLYDGWGNYVAIEMDSAGHVFGTMGVVPELGGVIATAVPSGTYNDGQTHHVGLKVSKSGSTVTVEVVVDGTASATATQSVWGIQMYTRLSIGGHQNGSLFNGTLCHVAVFTSSTTPLSTARLLEHRLAQSTGFAGERTDQRIARIASWVGLPAARQALDVGMTTSVMHIDCTGMSPLDYMRKVEETESGLLFVDAAGKLTFYSRARSYSPAAVAAAVPSYMLNDDARMAMNLGLVVNDVTGKRPDSVSIRLRDDASIAAYGVNTADLDLLTTSEAEVRDAVAWRLNKSATPHARFTNMTLDAFTDPTYSPQILSGTAVGARVQVTGMPSQAPAATQDVIVEGFTETITDSAWTFDVNASPYSVTQALTLDSATLGTLDGPGVLIY